MFQVLQNEETGVDQITPTDRQSGAPELAQSAASCPGRTVGRVVRDLITPLLLARSERKPFFGVFKHAKESPAADGGWTLLVVYFIVALLFSIKYRGQGTQPTVSFFNFRMHVPGSKDRIFKSSEPTTKREYLLDVRMISCCCCYTTAVHAWPLVYAEYTVSSSDPSARNSCSYIYAEIVVS